MAPSDEQAVRDRIRRGLVYTETEASFQDSRRRSDLVITYNQTPPADVARRRELLVAILGSVGERVVLLPLRHGPAPPHDHTSRRAFPVASAPDDTGQPVRHRSGHRRARDHFVRSTMLSQVWA